MRKYILLLVALTYINIVHAQSVASALGIEFGKAKTYSYATEEKLTYFIRASRTLHLLVYDSTLTVTRQRRFNLAEYVNKSEGVIGVTSLEGKPPLFFGDKTLEEFSSISYNSDSDNLVQFNYSKLSDDEFYLNSFSNNDKFYILCFKNGKDNPGFLVKEFNGDHTSTDHYISIGDMAINMGNSEQLYTLFFEAAGNIDASIVKRIRYDEPNTHVTAGSRVKSYVENDRLIITLDNVADTTQVITIDLRKYTSSFRKISAGGLGCLTDMRTVSNSFLVNNRLFYMAACRNNFLFKVIDLATGTSLKEFTTSKEEKIEYKNGPYHKVLNKKETEPELETKQLLNRFGDFATGANTGIGVNVDKDGEYEVYIGTSKSTAPYYPFSDSYMPVMLPMSPGGFGMHLLAIQLAWTEGFSNRTSDYENLYFKTHLSRDLQYIAKKDVVTIHDKLNKKIAHLTEDGAIEGVNTISFRNQLMLAYYDTDTRQFFASRFDPDKN